MFKPTFAFSGMSVDDLEAARQFYTAVLDLTIKDDEMGIGFNLPGGGYVYLYPKENHQPATYTALNFIVDDVEAAVDELAKRGVNFERYDGMRQDEKGIARGIAAKRGPDIAWFKDPAGNILSVLQEPPVK